jgi:hypothetical protein
MPDRGFARSTSTRASRTDAMTRSRPLPLALLAIVTCAALSCAHGGVGSTAGWSKVESRHFNLYAETPRDTQLVVTDLELAYAGLGATFFKNVEMPRVDVLVMTHETFGELMGFRRGTVALAGVPAGTIGHDGLIISKDDRARPVTAEAMAHLLIARAFPQAPLWFHEGFASYARTVQYREGNGQRVACFGLSGGERDPLIPLEQLVSLSWDDYDGDQARSWYKYTARMVIDFILHGAQGKNAGRMRPLIEAVAAGKSGREAIEAAFPSVDLQVLDGKLKEHAAEVANDVATGSPVRGLCPLAAKIAADRAVDEAKPTVTPASQAELDVLLQGLLRLPRRDGYPPWYPADVVARARQGAT